MNTLAKSIIILSFSPLFLLSLEAASIESLSVRIDKYMNLAQLHLQRAHLYIKKKNFKAASFDLKRAILIDPSLEKAQLSLADILIKESQIQEAKQLLSSLQKVSKKQEIQMQVNIFLGDISTQEGNLEEALFYYTKILDTNAVHTQEHYIKVADTYYELGNFRKSIKVLKMGLNVMINKEKLQSKIVDLSMKEGHYTLALSVLNKMIKNSSNEPDLYYKRAEILKEQGKIKEMKLDLKKAKIALVKESALLKRS